MKYLTWIIFFLGIFLPLKNAFTQSLLLGIGDIKSKPPVLKGILPNTIAADLVISKSSKYTSEDGEDTTVKVKLKTQPLAPVKVVISTNDKSESQLSKSMLLFNENNWNLNQTVIVTGKDDNIVDDDIEYQIFFAVDSPNDFEYSKVKRQTLSFTNIDNDAPGVVLEQLNKFTDEKGKIAKIIVRLKSKPAADVLLKVISHNPREGRAVTKSLKFSQVDWNIKKIALVTGVDDFVDDGDQEYRVSIGVANTLDSRYLKVPPKYAVFSNKDDDIADFMISKISSLSTNENEAESTFLLKLKTQPQKSVSILINSTNDREGVPHPNVVNFNAKNWEKGRKITVFGIDDIVTDGDQKYKIILKCTKSSDLPYKKLKKKLLNFTNIDNDKSGFMIRSLSGEINESGSKGNVAIKLTSIPRKNVKIQFDSSNPNEGSITPNSFIFTPENWYQDQLIHITGVDDDKLDGDQTFSLNFKKSISKDSNFNNLTIKKINIINRDNDNVGFYLSETSLETAESGKIAFFEIGLSSEPGADVVVHLESSDPTEVIVLDDKITFKPKYWKKTIKIRVKGINDNYIDGNKLVSVFASSVTSKDQKYLQLKPPPVRVLNRDDDTADIIFNRKNLETRENGNVTAIEFKLKAIPIGKIKLKVTSGNEKEGFVETSEILINPDQWSDKHRLLIKGVNDDIQDGDQPFRVFVGVSSEKDPNYNALKITPLQINNVDDDKIGVTTNIINKVSSENGEKAKISFRLRSQPLDVVAFVLYTSDQSEGKLVTSYVIFSPDDWNIEQVVEIAGVKDNIIDNDQIYQLVGKKIISNDPKYNGLIISPISISNTDIDKAAIYISQSTTQIYENGLPAQLEIALSSKPYEDVEILLKSNNETEGTVDISTLVFDQNNWDHKQIVKVTGVDDEAVDGNQAFSIAINAKSSDGNYNDLKISDVRFINNDSMQYFVGGGLSHFMPQGEEKKVFKSNIGYNLAGFYILSADYLMSINYNQTKLVGEKKETKYNVKQDLSYDLKLSALSAQIRYCLDGYNIGAGIGLMNWNLTLKNNNDNSTESSSGYNGIMSVVGGKYFVVMGVYILSVEASYNYVLNGLTNLQVSALGTMNF